MSKNQIRLLKFMIQFPISWHTIGQDSLKTARHLASLGLLEMNEHKQARLAITKSNRELLDQCVLYKMTNHD